MEPARSGIIPLSQHHAAALRQADLLAYAEQKALINEERLSRKVDSTDNSAIGSRRQPVQVDPDQHSARSVTGHIRSLQAYQRPEERFALQTYEVGQHSTPFLAQQVAQGQLPELSAHEIFRSDAELEHQQATQAYQDTRALTATVLGLQGFRERIA
ncbi:hypothetical protein GUA87_02500 [Sneathiella sp. P13V-1]|uniref:hypothetical protein n=1 Tax=Sneathiella sp. P13V-1 TaxID=2697366 RepID=UPI00187B8651|nr:hypothetical protein [Sneathiella sp. P13V-1]MBE7635700.1 hypothetical protein [Sneathiella sp. P13V-1]